jgi:redox-sensitive bicupin YhaK (pirin superfamily)
MASDHAQRLTATPSVEADSDAVLLFGHAEPIDEPIVMHGPFVMKTQEEITEAIHEYRAVYSTAMVSFRRSGK